MEKTPGGTVHVRVAGHERPEKRQDHHLPQLPFRPAVVHGAPG